MLLWKNWRWWSDTSLHWDDEGQSYFLCCCCDISSDNDDYACHQILNWEQDVSRWDVGEVRIQKEEDDDDDSGSCWEEKNSWREGRRTRMKFEITHNMCHFFLYWDSSFWLLCHFLQHFFLLFLMSVRFSLPQPLSSKKFLPDSVSKEDWIQKGSQEERTTRGLRMGMRRRKCEERWCEET